MTPDTTSETDWADQYIRRKLGDADDANVDPIIPPESAAFMDDLSYRDLSDVLPEDRNEHLEMAVHTLVCAMENEDGIAERDGTGRSVSAFSDDESVIAVIDGFGEVISVDRTTAALIAFAYRLDPRGIDQEGRGNRN